MTSARTPALGEVTARLTPAVSEALALEHQIASLVVKGIGGARLDTKVRALTDLREQHAEIGASSDDLGLRTMRARLNSLKIRLADLESRSITGLAGVLLADPLEQAIAATEREADGLIAEIRRREARQEPPPRG